MTPSPVDAVFPVLLGDLPAPLIRVYPRETVFAEKFEAITQLGIANSRMKDYFDLLSLVREDAMDPADLAASIRATFKRRGTTLTRDLPLGLTNEFARDAQKNTQWMGFLRKNRLVAPELEIVVTEIRAFLVANRATSS